MKPEDALRVIRDMGGTEGHEGDYYDCPQCDPSNGDDSQYHGRVMAYEQAAIVARAALAELAATPTAGAEVREP